MDYAQTRYGTDARHFPCEYTNLAPDGDNDDDFDGNTQWVGARDRAVILADLFRDQR